MEFVGNLRLLGWLTVFYVRTSIELLVRQQEQMHECFIGFTEKEYPVIRKPQGANIGEQRDIIRKVVKQKQMP